MGKEPNLGQQIEVRALAGANTPVTLRGAMVEKCPSAGCWFRLKDATGVAKVNLAYTRFTATDIPLNTEIVVSGKRNTESGALDATGLRW